MFAGFEIPTHLVTDWVYQGCNATNAVPPPAATQCAKAKELFRRGDSQLTLMENAEAVTEIKAGWTVSHPTGSADDKAIVTAIIESNSERESVAKMKLPAASH